ncbi:hypothetical protein NPX13_g8257 [Xylaria arbuscula]|uniref:Uncharacterized protein n=1 Tax=Xylaria arbuscula TaxID=114810 RepID=A0A9W8TII3_9PEZI|nr:hypothetical protein NPX13_g8257 [Xylaria arbuscula]
MAPTKRARAQTTAKTTKSSKKAKVTSSSSSRSQEKKKPARLAVPKNERKKNKKKVVISDRPVYSPNVDTDGFTEDDEDEGGAGGAGGKPRYASYAAKKGAGKEVGGDDGLPSVKSATATAATKAIATGPEQRKTARQ